MTFLTNQDQAERLFSRLIGEYRRQSFPYTEESLNRRPQNQVPPDLAGNANFWFYLSHLMRGMLKSDYAAAQVVRLYRSSPELFDPNYAVTLTATAIDDRLMTVFGNFPKWQRYGEAWQRNSEILIAWGGNILNVYKGARTEEQIRARIVNKRRYSLPLKERGFYMFQAKMCSLLTIFLMAARLIPTIRVSPPIDFHHMRVMVGTGMIQLKNGRYKPVEVAATGDEVGRRYLDRFQGMHPVKFADLLFVLSREGCKGAVTEQDANWDDPETLKRYQRSCGRCPLEEDCHQTVITGEYYIRDGKKRPRVIQVISRPKPPEGKR